jgi:excisionase family DNA binding protein
LPREFGGSPSIGHDPVATAKGVSAIAWVERYLSDLVRAAVRQELAESRTATAMPNQPSEYLTIARAAEVADVHPCTIREWIKGGTLKAYRCGTRGYRILRNDLDAHLTLETADPTTEEISGRVDAIFAKHRTSCRAG